MEAWGSALDFTGFVGRIAVVSVATELPGVQLRGCIASERAEELPAG
jgi:hypothetical protein